MSIDKLQRIENALRWMLANKFALELPTADPDAMGEEWVKQRDEAIERIFNGEEE